MTLYRKWRSRSFDDLIGQEHVVRTLRNAVQQGRVAHAYLFTGPRGTGKTSTARILAKAVNCLHPHEGNPCNECEMCVAANEGRAMDVVEIDAASNTSVENVRDLRERVAYAASEGRYKVYIVDEVHRLSGAAFDAFLKTLEEPPPHVIFVFASTEPHKVPATITSRCQRFDFHRFSADQMLGRLQLVAGEEGVRASNDALHLIAQNANGSMRDALGLLDQVASYTQEEVADGDVRSALGLADASVVSRLTDHLLDRDTGAGLSELGAFLTGGGDPRQLMRQFVDYWRALLLVVSGAKHGSLEVDVGLSADLERHAARLSSAQVTAVLQTMAEQEFSPKYNIPASLPFELGYVRSGLLLGPAGGDVREVGVAPSPEPVPGNVERIEVVSEHRSETPEPAAASPSPPDDPEEELASSGNIVSSNGSAVTDITGAWPAILAALRAQNKSLEAVLRSGHPLRMQDGELTIGFPFPFHLRQFAEVKKRRILEEIVTNVTGVSYRVNCVKVTKEELATMRGSNGDDDIFFKEVSDQLRDFHARELRDGT